MFTLMIHIPINIKYLKNAGSKVGWRHCISLLFFFMQDKLHWPSSATAPLRRQTALRKCHQRSTIHHTTSKVVRCLGWIINSGRWGKHRACSCQRCEFLRVWGQEAQERGFNLTPQTPPGFATSRHYLSIIFINCWSGWCYICFLYYKAEKIKTSQKNKTVFT